MSSIIKPPQELQQVVGTGVTPQQLLASTANHNHRDQEFTREHKQMKNLIHFLATSFH
jgi:hypothetical protein